MGVFSVYDEKSKISGYNFKTIKNHVLQKSDLSDYYSVGKVDPPIQDCSSKYSPPLIWEG